MKHELDVHVVQGVQGAEGLDAAGDVVERDQVPVTLGVTHNEAHSAMHRVRPEISNRRRWREILRSWAFVVTSSKCRQTCSANIRRCTQRAREASCISPMTCARGK